MQHFKLLWVDLWFFLQVVSIILYVLLAMTIRKMTTALIVITFVFSIWYIRLIILIALIFWLFFILLLLFVWLCLLVILFNALIEQVLIDHHNFFDWLVAVTLLLTRIVNDQPLFMGEKAWEVQFTTLTPFVGSIERGTRTIRFSLGRSNALGVVYWLCSTRACSHMVLLGVNEFTMRKKEFRALWVDLRLTALSSQEQRLLENRSLITHVPLVLIGWCASTCLWSRNKRWAFSWLIDTTCCL